MSVVVVGSINRDVVARVVRIPDPGETVLGASISRGAGGKGANQAVAAARAGGASCAFVGAVGPDGDGEELRRALADDGIDVAGLRTAPQHPTGTALISVSDDGENAIVVIPGANHAFERLAPRQRELVASADVVVAQLEIPVALVRDAAEARADGALFVLNGAPSSPLLEPGVADGMLGAVDVLVVNEHELQDIAGIGDPDEAIALLARRVRALVVTRGADGCVVTMDGTSVHIDAYPAHPVDTTGAGDTFCGVLAARLVRGGRSGVDRDSLVAAADAASAAAALAVGREGAQAAVPGRAEVDRLREGRR